MWESLPQAKTSRSRRRALAFAVSTHAAVIVTVLVFSEWKVEAMAPPETRPTYWIPVTLPSSGGNVDPKPPKPPKPPTKPTRPTAPTRQPIEIAQTAPVPPIPQEPSGAATDPDENRGGGGGGEDTDVDTIPQDPSPEPAPEPEPPLDVVYKLRAIDVVPARSLDCPEPAYSALARSMRLEGEVVIAAVIGLDGRASDIVVLSGSPVLARLATEAVARCRFAPAELRGHPVRSEYRQTVTFTLR